MLRIELTLPKIFQTLIITRGFSSGSNGGLYKGLRISFAKRGLNGDIYIGIHLIDKVVRELKEGESSR